MNTIIKVDNLTKEYIIGQKKQEPYTTLRDSIANKIRSVWGTRESDEYKKFLALNNLNFEIKQGDRVGIIGRNGAGKSTLLKILSRITDPTIGKVKIEGRVASLLEVGTGFHPELTGRENIFLNGAILGMARQEIKKKFDEIVEFAEISQFLDTPVKRYSSGMYVRLAFAVAAHLESEILIVDEVLAVGDYQFRKKCLAKMSDVHEDGRTVLFVSHDLSQIKALCNTGILLNSGEIVKTGDINEVVNTYIKSGSSDSEQVAIRKREPKEIEVGPQGPKIQEVSLIDESGKLKTQFLSNEKFEIALKIKPYYESPKLFAALWFLHDQTGQQIAVGASSPMDNVLYPQSIEEIRCLFDPKSLVPGTYYLRFVLHIPYYDNFDDWKNAICFEVVENDAKKTGYNYPGIWSAQQYVDHKWKI